MNGVLVATGHMYEIENALVSSGFFKCNRCYLVNMKYVKAVTDNTVEMVNGEKLQISRNKRKDFLEALTEYLCGSNEN